MAIREILRKPDATTASIGAAPGALPPDLVEQASRRLAIAALVYASVYGIAYSLSRLLGAFPRRWVEAAALQSDLTAVFFIGVSLVVFAVAISGRVDPYRLIGFGLVYEVIGALGAESDIIWWPEMGFLDAGAPAVGGISWTCVWIVIYPMLVPSTPGKATIAAFTAASLRPLMLVILAARGIDLSAAGFNTGKMVELVLPNYLCAGIAAVGARILYSYGKQISKARRMGSYQLVEKLGEGGMGEVWKAEHRMLARPAAIKLIRSELTGTEPGGSSGSAVHRFEREVQATAQLRSPHTVEVYDYGLTDDGTFYYVLELLDGLNLQQLIETHGPLPAERVVYTMRQACRSLAEAHESGLVHRDIKPGNIFVCRYGIEHDFIKVLDFGLVKKVGPATEKQLSLTEVGTFAGTPAYGAPEAAMPERMVVDARSDIYSLGCVAYWMLTGSMVFKAQSAVEMILAHVNEIPEPPSHRTELEIPAALDGLILECLAKDKAERPQTAAELDERLAAVPCPEAWTPARARAWWELHKPDDIVEESAVDSTMHVEMPYHVTPDRLGDLGS